MLSSGQEFDEKLLDSKHDLKVIFKPSKKNKDFFIFTRSYFKILHLIRLLWTDYFPNLYDFKEDLIKKKKLYNKIFTKIKMPLS